MEGMQWDTIFLLLLLMAATAGSVIALVWVADVGTVGTEFTQGMVLTALTGVISTFLASITLIVKAFVDIMIKRRGYKKSKFVNDKLPYMRQHDSKDNYFDEMW